MKMQKSDFCPALLAVWALLLFSLRKSSAFDLDADGFPILWQPQTGLLFRPKETYDIADVSDDLGNAFLPDNEPVGRWPKVIAFHAGHDASIAIGVAGRVQCVLELERLFEERYFYLGGGVHSEDADYSQSWLVALTVVLEKCECDSGSCPGRFDYAVLDNFEDHEFGLLKQAVGPLLGSPTWRFTNHHLSHALLGFYASPFRSAMILSYDAGGNDGVLNFYIGIGLDVKLGLRLPVNMGMAYNMISLLLPEVTGAKNSSMICSEDFDINPYTFQETAAAMHELPDLIDVVGRVTQSYPGKFMGYSALAKPHPEVQFWARQYIRNYLQNETAMSEAFSWLRAFSCGGTKNQRILAASAQDEWTTYVEELFGKSLQSATAILGQPLDGIVLTGGCALNVLANQRIYESYTEKLASNPHLPRSFYVPPASNDGGIVIGAIWSVMPPLAPQSLQYLGFPLFDFDSLDEAASSHQARSLTELGGVEYLADLLAGGESWKNENKARARPIIAVVIGRQEVGPRALGHRSLLAVPDVDIKDRMNQLKARQSYRPVAPMIADEALEEVFGEGFVKSPYMTMAPRVKQSVRERFPALAHVDGTARHQSVGAEDEPWIHALLLAVGRKTGLAALINTSFNSKGKPIVNTVRESLKMLDDLPDLDFVLIEDWLFEKGTLHHSSALFQFA